MMCQNTQPNHIFLIYMHEKNLAVNSLQWLICHKTQPNWCRETINNFSLEFSDTFPSCALRSYDNIWMDLDLFCFRSLNRVDVSFFLLNSWDMPLYLCLLSSWDFSSPVSDKHCFSPRHRMVKPVWLCCTWYLFFTKTFYRFWIPFKYCLFISALFIG